jgi:hypothetical protein
LDAPYDFGLKLGVADSLEDYKRRQVSEITIGANPSFYIHEYSAGEDYNSLLIASYNPFIHDDLDDFSNSVSATIDAQNYQIID